MERLRERLTPLFPRPVDGLTVVMHDNPASLAASSPMLSAMWALTEPTSRRHLNGWAGRHELHVLTPAALRAREAPAAAPLTLYARRLIVESNHDLHRALAPARLVVAVRWAWLLEGASRHFSGESRLARPAVVRRLREGRQPSFPPSVRDAPLLAGTVIDLLAAEEGEQAVVELATRLHSGGARGALAKAFGGRPLVHTEGNWRSYLSRLASAQI